MPRAFVCVRGHVCVRVYILHEVEHVEDVGLVLKGGTRLELSHQPREVRLPLGVLGQVQVCLGLPGERCVMHTGRLHRTTSPLRASIGLPPL